jgi:hypothetical protein
MICEIETSRLFRSVATKKKKKKNKKNVAFFRPQNPPDLKKKGSPATFFREDNLVHKEGKCQPRTQIAIKHEGYK